MQQLQDTEAKLQRETHIADVLLFRLLAAEIELDRRQFELALARRRVQRLEIDIAAQRASYREIVNTNQEQANKIVELQDELEATLYLVGPHNN